MNILVTIFGNKQYYAYLCIITIELVATVTIQR